MNRRRDALKSVAATTIALSTLPKNWTKPLLGAVVIPAHAQTSCSGFTTTQVNESLTLTVTDTMISGPIDAIRTANNFSQIETTDVGGCRDNETLSARVEFSGTIDSANNSISGEINILQNCGADFVCEQISTFTATQNMPSSSDNGDYTGTVIGTLRCCDDF